MEQLVLHEDPRSGSCYKIRLTAALLGLPLERRVYDVLKGETRTPEFRAQVNADCRIPVLQTGNRFLPESNAACWYLAENTSLIPKSRFEQADCLRWMFWEQNSHEPNIAKLRFWFQFVGESNLTEVQRLEIPYKRLGGEAALTLMDEHLSKQNWLVGDQATLADVSLFAYSHICEGGGFCLDTYPAVSRWLRRVEALPGFVPMDG